MEKNKKEKINLLKKLKKISESIYNFLTDNKPIALLVLLLMIVAAIITIVNNKPENPGPPTPNGDECKRFNIEDWQTGQGQLVQENELWSVASASLNGMLRYKEFMPLSSEIKIVFVPHSEEEMNFAIHAHNLYEIVVGDGGYRATTLKASSRNNQAMKIISNTDGYTRNIFEEGEFNPGIDVTIVLDQTISRIDEDSYEINIRILHRAGEEEKEDKIFATYDFLLPPKFSYEKADMRFSIGLLAAANGTKVSTEILCFEVSQ